MRLPFAVVLTLMALIAVPCLAQDGDPVSTNVTYVTGSSVYLSAGQEEGLTTGTRLTLLRGETVVAQLEVREVSAHRAVCSMLERVLDPEIGDLVRFVPVKADPATDVAGAEITSSPNTRSGGRLRGLGIRGRAGVSYLFLRDREYDDAGYSQPALNLRIDGRHLAGSPWGFAVDVRARRLDRNGSEGTDESRNRVYRLAIGREGITDPWSFTIGRQFAADLAAVSIFDGISARYAGKRWAVGLVTGTQPSTEDFGFSSDIHEHGVYFRFSGKPKPHRNWALTTGLIGSYQGSEPNREFFYVQGRYQDRKLSTFVAGEFDVNREWKEQLENDTVSLTSVLVNLRYAVNQVVSLHGGYDNRRNVRLYRDHVTPETEFDDSFRSALWAGTSLFFQKRYRVGIDLRTMGGGSAGDADSFTVRFDVIRLTSWNVTLGVRGTRYTHETLEGSLYSLRAGTDLGRRVRLDLSGGVREEENLFSIPLDNRVQWIDLDLEVDLGRHWYWLISGERTDGDLEQIDQVYTALNFHF